MKTILICMALWYGQTMITHQEREVVHMPANTVTINFAFGGKRLDLINCPATIFLPKFPPKEDAAGNPWTLDIRNLGPSPVTVASNGPFSVNISVKQTVHIASSGLAYSLTR
jgi:hypothetical protein